MHFQQKGESLKDKHKMEAQSKMEKMMNGMRRAAGIGALALILAGCSSNKAERVVLQEVEGVPVSVSSVVGYKGFYSSIASYIYVNGNQGSGMLASKDITFGRISSSQENSRICQRAAQAVALIQSEIAKGNNGKVKFYGQNGANNVFEIYIVEAGGYKIGLR
jgi:hypothetical protein